MNHNQLINFLKQYGRISETEKQNIEKYFTVLQVKKKQILIERHSPCNRLFFINKGLLRAYYLSEKGKEVTRMIAWENRFLTNIISFKNFTENNEIIECIKNATVLSISRENFEILLKTSPNLKSVYADLLEEYNAMHTQRFEVLNAFDLHKKIKHLKQEFPHLLNQVNDTILASFLGMNRETFTRNKNILFSN